MRKVFLVGFMLLAAGRGACAQHLGELSGNYSYLRYEPASGLSAIGLNGGGGAAVIYFAGFFGLKAEVEAYADKTVNFNFPPGSLRCPSGCTGSAQADLFNFNVGPTLKFRIKGFQPFVEGMVGGAHTNFYKNLARNCASCFTSASGLDNYALDVVVGGGIDFKVAKHVAIRPIEFDYVLTRFALKLANDYNQNNFRYQAGLVFEF